VWKHRGGLKTPLFLMKKALLLALAIVAAPALALADLTFVQNIESHGQNTPLTLKSKETKIRIDMGDQASTVMDINSGEMTTLMHANKAFMKVDPAVLQMMQAQMKQQMGDAAQKMNEMKPTGEKEKVGSIETEIYSFAGSNMKGKFWIAKDYPNGDKLLALLKKIHDSPAGKMAGSMGGQPDSYPGVPVKSEMEVSGQKVVVTLVSVNDENLDNALFTVPGDYKAMTAPAIPGQ